MESENNWEFVSQQHSVEPEEDDNYWQEINKKVRIGEENLRKSSEALRYLYDLDKLLCETVFSDENLYAPGFSNLINCEESLLGLASENEVDGIFYVNVLNDHMMNRKIARCFSSGSFNGFLETEGTRMLMDAFGEIHIVKVFTTVDIGNYALRNKLLLNKNNDGPKKAKRSSYHRLLHLNKTSVTNCSMSLVEEVNKSKRFECGGYLIYLEKKNSKFSSTSDDRLLLAKKKFQDTVSTWEESLRSYKRQYSDTFKEHTVFDEVEIENFADQLKIACSLPNYFKYVWDPTADQSLIKPRFLQRFSTSSRYNPGSPRCRIIRDHCYDQESSITRNTLQTLLGVYTIPANTSNSHKQQVTRSIKAEGRKPINLQDLCENFGVNFDEAISNSNNLVARNTDKTLYQHFTEKQFSDGFFAWRVFKNDLQTILLNDIDSQNGEFKDNEWVKVEVRKSGESSSFFCNCQLFGMVESILKEDEYSTIGCVHTRFIKDVLELKKTNPDISIDKSYFHISKIQTAFEQFGTQILNLPAKHGVKRYSVVTDDLESELITIYDVKKSGKRVITCHNSRCKSIQPKNRVVTSLKSDGQMCKHLKTFRDNINLDEEFCISHQTESDLHYDLEEINLLDPEVDEFDLTIQNKVNFNEETKLWTFHQDSISKLKVDDDQFSESLKSNSRQRTKETFEDGKTDLCAFSTGMCECELEWTNDENRIGNLILEGECKIYSLVGPKVYHLYGRKCLNKTCYRSYDGSEHSIYRVSRDVGCGYEVGWEFVSSVRRSKQSFSGFVKVMNERYERLGFAQKFMSLNSFIKWWFAWASAMEIDFIQSCPSCKENPKVLAGDATKIGTTIKQSNVTPIETPDDSETLPTKTRRFDRTFMNSRNVGNEKAKIITSNIKATCDIMRQNKDTLKTSNFMNAYISTINNSPNIVKHLLHAMCYDNTIENDERNALLDFVELIVEENCMLHLLPYQYISIAEQAKAAFETKLNLNKITDFISQSRFFCPELSKLMIASSKHSNDSLPKPYIFSILDFLTSEVKSLITLHTDAAASTSIEKYNPPKYGRAYYFTKTGDKLRNPRRFDIDKPTKCNFDDFPQQCCNKVFPTVTKRGVTYLFVWFCPAHFHCYGYHIIPESEGRKDPMWSLYCYTEAAPEIVFYDFACSLDEYARNRESGYFQNTRFFHDIFHGYTHKCSRVFRWNRINVNGYQKFNTSICEQFNSYLQCIKASSKLMTQEHFNFYVQFFIHEWNRERQHTINKNLSVLAAIRE